MYNYNRITLLLLLCISGISCSTHSDPSSSSSTQDYPIRPVPFTDVKITGDFWSSRLETNRTVTLPFDFKKCEETGRIDNFAIAGGLMMGEFTGKRYNDSDVFKVMEAAAYSLQTHFDEELDQYLDDLIAKIAAAQEEDGYLYTTRTINPQDPSDAQPGRWTNLYRDHELYNVGHMYEAAVAHYRATGKRNFLDIAIKNANLIDRVFGPGKKTGVPGHQEIEIGLARLYRVTGEDRYLRLARYFLDQRGQAGHDKLTAVFDSSGYAQNHMPVVKQTEAIGHAVRAGYMYAAMADIAALTADSAYMHAIERIWENVVNKKLYLTGGVGSSRRGEAFGDNYSLPNAKAYNETCAAIASMMWNHRLFLLQGDGKYLDILERTLYNGFLAGVSLHGDSFFYPNPLESDGHTAFNQGKSTRSPWFSTACCPVNVVRFLPSLPGYVYAWTEDRLYVNLYLSNQAEIHTPDQTITIYQETRYPWNGTIRMKIQPEKADSFTLCLRIPGWADNQPVPGNLYSYLHRTNRKIILNVNGQYVFPKFEKGFAMIKRLWQEGDLVELTLPMSVRRVQTNPEVMANKGKIALERGPLVYCLEAADNPDGVLNLQLPARSQLDVQFKEDLLGGINQISGTAKAENGASVPFQAIPYYAWSHRGEGEMAVWLKAY